MTTPLRIAPLRPEDRAGFTLPEMRGHGVARALIAAVGDAARAGEAARGCWLTHETNAPPETDMSSPFDDRAHQFRRLHEQAEALLMPNAWDPGSARLIAGVGFQALATSSGAAAAVLGRQDGQLSRDEAIAHAKAIVEATALPVSADLENGFGADVSAVVETIRRAGEIGLAGGSIEDSPADAAPYDFQHAVERVAAAVEAARALPRPFTLTARTENYLRGRPDLDDTLRRLQAFEQAGADVLFAPALPDLESVRTVCGALKKPVSFMVGIPGKSFSVADLQAAGVRRISFATSFYRAAMRMALAAATEVKEHGTFHYLSKP